MEKLLEWFWKEVTGVIVRKYRNGNPADWKKDEINLFIAKLASEVLHYCNQNATAARNCRVNVEHRDAAVKITYDTFRRIFKTGESKGNITTRNIFSVYCGYPSFTDFVKQRYSHGESTSEEIPIRFREENRFKKLNKKDKKVAWDIFIELRTRVATRPLSMDNGTEEAALNSIYQVFVNTRETLKRHGPIAKEVRNCILDILDTTEPFTSSWHRKKIDGAFAETEQCKLFRQELLNLQSKLNKHLDLLEEMVGH